MLKVNASMVSMNVNQCISGLQFFMKNVCGQIETAGYIRPKKETKLPDVLTLEEVKRILSHVENIKHKAILYLTYSSGLRVGEVVRLKLPDVESKGPLHDIIGCC